MPGTHRDHSESGGPGSRAGRAGTSETRTARRPALSMPGTTTPRTHWHRGTGSPWHGPPRLPGWRPSLTALAGPDSGLDSGESARPRPQVTPDRPDSESDPGPGPIPIGRPYDRHVAVTPVKVTGTTRRLGWSEPRPGPTRRGPASLRGETRKISQKYH